MIDTVAKMSMGILFLAATPLDAGGAELWANWGLAGVVVGYVLYRDWQREKRMGAAIDGQQKWIRETLVEALGRNAQAMERMVETAESCRRRAERCTHPSEESSHAYHG